MTVAQRLYIAVLPGVLGVGLVAALAYWGEYQRQAPMAFIAVAGVLVVASLALTWVNTRYVVRRIEALAHVRSHALPDLRALLDPLRGDVGPDELDAIQSFVTRLGAEVQAAQADATAAQQDGERKRRDLAGLLAAAASAARAATDEVRLPLHILAETRFGELNDNQLELLADARAAAERADRALERVRAAGALAAGQQVPRRERVSLTELLRGIEPQCRAIAVRRDVTLELDIEPGLPRLLGDRERWREALLALVTDALAAPSVRRQLLVRARVRDGRPVLSLEGGDPAAPPSLEGASALVSLLALGMRHTRIGAVQEMAFDDSAS